MASISLIDLFVENPVIAAIRGEDELDEVLKHKSQVVFILSSNICTVEESCKKLKDAGKNVFLHMDLVEGLRSDHAGIHYILEHIAPTGVISTKSTPIRLAHAAGLHTIQRTFMLDSSALKTSIQNASSCQPDFVEVLPGICPQIIAMVQEHIQVPIIAGGFVQDKRDVMAALRAGAIAVSTSQSSLWSLDDE